MSSNPSSNANDNDRYEAILSVFWVLSFGAVVAVLIVFILQLAEKPPLAYPLVAALATVLSTGFAGYYSRRRRFHWDTEKVGEEITVEERKVALIVSFTCYVIGIHTLVGWTGGARNSPFGSVLLLTASLSTFVAVKTWAKIFVGFLTVASYSMNLVWFFDYEATKMEFLWPPKGLMVFDVVVCSIVVVVSGFLSQRIRQSARLSAAAAAV